MPAVVKSYMRIMQGKSDENYAVRLMRIIRVVGKPYNNDLLGKSNERGSGEGGRK